LMKACWDGDASKRPTFSFVVKSLTTLFNSLT